MLAIIGGCVSSSFTLVIEYTIELTYPESITIMLGINSLFQQIFGIILTTIGQYFISSNDDKIKGGTFANITFCSALGIASLLQVFVKEDLRRQKADTENIDSKTEL